MFFKDIVWSFDNFNYFFFRYFSFFESVFRMFCEVNSHSNFNLGVFSIIVNKMLRIRGPRMKPIIPNMAIPPKSPISITTGWIFDFLPTRETLNIESMYVLRMIPRTTTPIAVPMFPFANSIIATGTHISRGPSAGTSANIPISTPSTIANLTPKSQNPIMATVASISASRKVPTRMSLITNSI